MANGSFHRRDALKFVAGAGALSAGLAAGGSQAQEGGASMSAEENAASGGADMPSPKWHRFTIGDFKITAIQDGSRIADGPHPTFGADQPAEAVSALMRENFLPESRFVNGFTPVLVERGDELVLFDTGMGAGARANGMGMLVPRMAEAGYRPEDVDIVVLTHFHGDHISGLMEEDVPVFPSARYVAGAQEYEWWTSDEAKSGDRAEGAALVERMVVPLRENMTLVEEGDEIADGITAHEAFGHSPGHMIFTLESPSVPTLWLTADTSNHFVASLQRPDWEVRFDQDKAMATETRKRVFDRIAQERAPFIGYHMPFPSVGYAERLPAGGYRFVPASYQFDV